MPDVARQLKMSVGLGDAIKRVISVELRYAHGHSAVPEALLEERDMLVAALNQIPLDLGFNCDGSDVPESIEIFRTAAETSCCRIVDGDNSRRQKVITAPEGPAKGVVPMMSTSRTVITNRSRN